MSIHLLRYIRRRVSNARYFGQNVKYVYANITSIAFRDYNAFYPYNSFCKNIDINNRIYDTLRLNAQLYDAYSIHTVEQLADLPVGVRLAIYYTSITIVPKTFRLIDSLYNGGLRLGKKQFSITT